MNILAVRVANCILTIVIVFSQKFILLYYVFAMHGSIEFLNKQSLYLNHAYKLYNFIFWSYELVLLERIRTFKFSIKTEWLINNAEHIAFGLIICLKIYIYLAVLLWKNTADRWKRVIAVILIFNLIGFINEYFQNVLSNRALFLLIPDSVKDIQMNLIGTNIFFLTALCRIVWLKKKSTT